MVVNEVGSASYETSERTSHCERALGTIDRKIQGAISVDEILQATVRELGKALRVPYTAIELHMNPQADTITEEIKYDIDNQYPRPQSLAVAVQPSMAFD